MPPTWGGCLLRAGRPMLWMPVLSFVLADPVSRLSRPIRMTFGLSIQPFAL
jgi:hypothetical protein